MKSFHVKRRDDEWEDVTAAAAPTPTSSKVKIGNSGEFFYAFSCIVHDFDRNFCILFIHSFTQYNSAMCVRACVRARACVCVCLMCILFENGWIYAWSSNTHLLFVLITHIVFVSFSGSCRPLWNASPYTHTFTHLRFYCRTLILSLSHSPSPFYLQIFFSSPNSLCKLWR